MTTFHKIVTQGMPTSLEPSEFVGRNGDLTVSNGEISSHDGTTPGGVPLSGLPVITLNYEGPASNAYNSIGTIGDSGIFANDTGAADVIFSVSSHSDVVAAGVMVFINGTTSVFQASATDGTNGIRFQYGSGGTAFFSIIYAQNSTGVAYTIPTNGSTRTSMPCMAPGTLISTLRGEIAIEHITYDDKLLVWDFDNGKWTHANPLWIGNPVPVSSFNRHTFSDGSVINLIGKHRIFNKEAKQFTYTMTDDTPLGTISYTKNGKYVTLDKVEVFDEPTFAYNIITDYHINMVADGILTSNGFNNMYPIVDMKFVKDGSRDNFKGFSMPSHWFTGLRMSEQQRDFGFVRRYIDRLMANDIANFKLAG